MKPEDRRRWLLTACYVAEAKAVLENAKNPLRMPGCKFPHCGCNPTFMACEHRDEK